jgi:T4 bacteriophage base plate protein
MPSIDVDAAIIAIRIASYGNQMDFNSKCPHCETENDYAIDLSVVLSNISAPVYNKKVPADDLKIKLKPQPYFSVNRSNMIAFEEQQILRTLGTMEDNPEEAKQMFDKQLGKLVDLNILMMADSTDYIEMADGTIVTDHSFIQEFYQNCDTKIVKTVREQLEEYSKAGGLKPFQVNCKNEECVKEFDVGITFDFASFFAVGS